MKKTLNVISTIAIILIVVGALFKIMHYPGAAIFLPLGMIVFGMGFIPIYALSKIKPLKGWKIKSTIFLGYFCSSLLCLFLLAKLYHWPITGPLFVISAILFSLFFLPAYTVNKMRNSESKPEKMMHLFGGLSVALFALGWAFKVMHYPLSGLLLLIGVLIFLTTYLPYIYKTYKGDPGKKSEKLVWLTLLSILITTLIAFVFSNAPGMFMNSFALTQETIEASSNNINSRNESILNALQKGSEFKERADKAKSLANNLYNHIERMKSHLIATTSKISPEQADSLSPYDLGPKDNYDTPTAVLIGGDIESLRTGRYSAIELKNKIIVFREDILGLLNERERSEISKHLGLSVLETYPMEDWGAPVNWEIHTFLHVPLAGVLNILSQIQNDVRVAENSVISGLQYESLIAGKNVSMK